MIIIKTNDEIKIMREAGRIVAKTLALLQKNVKPGITTKELDRIAEDFILNSNAKPAFKGYRGYPATICASINSEIVHGIPSDRVLEEGDIISIDVGAFYEGYCGDSAMTFPVGNVSPTAKKLLKVTKKALENGISILRPGIKLGELSLTIQKFVESRNYSVVKNYVGHGIGKNMHEDPQIPNFLDPDMPQMNVILKPGMTFAIEPMVNAGTERNKTLENNWTVVTMDDSLSAHFEHSVVITEKGFEILTLI